MSARAIVIPNITHFANSGSMGRIEGLITSLQRAMPDVRITILHRYYKYDKNTLVKRLLDKYPGIEVKEHPWYREACQDTVTAMSSLVRFCIVVINLKFSHSDNGELKKHDVILDVNLIEPDEDTYMVIGNILALLNIWYAVMTGKPVIISSATIGPYKNRLLRQLAKHVLNRTKIITLREGYSQNFLSTLGVNAPPVYLTADLAFLLEPAPTETVSAILGGTHALPSNKPLIGISPSDEMHPSLKEPKYIQLMVELSDYLITDLKARIIYIPHTFRDKAITGKIYEELKNKQEAQVVQLNMSASEIKGVIGLCDMFIGSRFHALVAATSLAVPTIGLVSYSRNKFHGIIGEMMGQEGYLLDVDEEFEYESFLGKLKLKVNDLRINNDQVVEDLKAHAQTAKAQALFNGELVKSLLDSTEYED